MSTIITSPKAPAALGPYSHAVLDGSTLYTSGQIGLVPETGVLAGDTIESQAEQVFQNLEGTGCRRYDLPKCSENDGFSD